MSIDLSLDRIQRLQEYLPRYTRPTCHIAGTNGKGSVSALLTSIFLAASPPLQVGRFNSPHLVSIRDSITINDEPVSWDTYSNARSRVEYANSEHNIKASKFELLTITALLIFEEAKVDIAVVEVGMGGRLDATNIISDDCILVSGLAAVDLDHQAFLGSTVAEIAKEKAAISRKGKPFILGCQKYPEVIDSVQEVVAACGGELIQASLPYIRDWDEAIDGPSPIVESLHPSSFQVPPPQPVEVLLPIFSEPLRLLLPLHGNHQLVNLGTALSMVSALLTHPSCARLNLRQRIDENAIRRGVRSVRWPGRLSFYTISWPLNPGREQTGANLLVLIDGAHNPSSSETLAAYIDDLLSQVSKNASRSTSRRRIKLTYLLALSHSPPKEPIQTLSPLFPPRIPSVASNIQIDVNVGVLRFTPPEEMPWVKSVSPSDLRDVVTALLPQGEVWVPRDENTPEGQLNEALEWAYKKQKDEDGNIAEGLVVIAGSLYLVADFYRLSGSGGR